MITFSKIKLVIAATALCAVSACGGKIGTSTNSTITALPPEHPESFSPGRSTIWDIFKSKTVGREVNVNKYIWTAALDVLNFLPVESVDPFTGVIVTGYGRPPGGGRAYRATILISDAALEARSLNLAMQTRSGPVSAGTVRAVEDAILARARQLRIADGKL